MRCTDCGKKCHGTAKQAMVALASAASLASGAHLSRRECRFYPCPSGNGFHLTSEPASSFDKSKYARLSAMVMLNADRVLSALDK